MNLCPSHKNLLLKSKETADIYEDNFFSDKFDLINDEKTAYLKEIRANTSIPFSVIMLGCHKWKDLPQNYCDILLNPQTAKKACESNKTDYIFFYINRWFNEKSENKTKEHPMYFLAFVYYSDDKDIPKKITDEVKKTSKWFGISGNTIQCYVFYYTVNYLCNTFDWGTFKKKYDEQCKDPKYIFQFKYVPPKEKPQYLSVNGGFPRFTIEVQEI